MDASSNGFEWRNSMKRNSVQGISYLESGRGPVLLLLHGIPGAARTWERAARRLERRFRVIAPDLRGFGQSDDPGEDYDMEGQARALKRLLEELGVRRCYIGAHDFGGPVALTLMRIDPELEVQGLLLASTNVFTDTFVPVPLRAAKVPILGRALFWAMAGTRLGFRMMYAQACARKDVLRWEAFSKHATPGGLRYTSLIFRKSLSDLPRHYASVEAFLSSIAVPTVVVWGTRDPFFAVDVGRRTSEAIRGAKLIVYENTGHFVPEEQPERIAEDIERVFLP